MAFFLAQAVNAASQLVNIGVLGTDGVITPQRSSQANSVFVRSLAAFTFTIDIETSPPPPPSGPVEFNYPTGRGRYTAGTIVRGTDGNIYKCAHFRIRAGVTAPISIMPQALGWHGKTPGFGCSHSEKLN